VGRGAGEKNRSGPAPQAEEVLMEKYLIDSKILGEVIALRPIVGLKAEEIAKFIVQKLAQISNDSQFCEVIHGRSKSRYYLCKVADLTEWINLESGQPVSINEIGMVTNELGFRKLHRRDGRWMAWNDRQIEILQSALGV